MKKLIIAIALIALMLTMTACTEVQSDKVGQTIVISGRGETITAVYEVGGWVVYKTDGIAPHVEKKEAEE